MKRTWKQVWDERTLDPSRGGILSQLLAADGFDATFGEVDETSWTEFVDAVANELGLVAGTSVFEVGCGAGAFLYRLHQRGCVVSGIDQSPALIMCARQTLPGRPFDVAEATQIDLTEETDAVVSCSVFSYFPCLDHAAQVLGLMAAKARRVVAVLDVPDAATAGRALAHRQAELGGEADYTARYDGLEHQQYDRGWMAEAMNACGLEGVRVVDQAIAGYGNAPYRFNAWGFVPAR